MHRLGLLCSWSKSTSLLLFAPVVHMGHEDHFAQLRIKEAKEEPARLKTQPQSRFTSPAQIRVTD